VSRFRKLVERIPEMHNAQYYWVVQYNIIRTELRKVSAQLTTTGEMPVYMYVMCMYSCVYI
jgi:hypothetical protein